MHCALLGDQLATLATEDKWNGIIINGCLRDTQLINSIEIDIRALNTSPVKRIKHNSGETDSIVKLGGVNFIYGDYTYVDSDGILVCKYNLINKIQKMKGRKLLMIPGPIEFEPEVLQAMGMVTTSHVAPNFIEVFGHSLELMR